MTNPWVADAKDYAFDEAEHPRDDRGRWVEVAGEKFDVIEGKFLNAGKVALRERNGKSVIPYMTGFHPTIDDAKSDLGKARENYAKSIERKMQVGQALMMAKSGANLNDNDMNLIRQEFEVSLSGKMRDRKAGALLEVMTGVSPSWARKILEKNSSRANLNANGDRVWNLADVLSAGRKHAEEQPLFSRKGKTP